MLRKFPWPWPALWATLGLFGVASYVPWSGMWGINHLAFLDQSWGIICGILAIGIAALFFVRLNTSRADKFVIRLSQVLFERSSLVPLTISLAFGVVFWCLRPETHFLGDGYTLLSIFGQGEHYIKRWAEPGSIFLVRQIQTIIGEYTRSSALLTFQLLSVSSGAVVVFNFIAISRKLTDQPLHRLVVLSLLLGSGVLLQFMGYVEYYPLLWAAVTSFMSAALNFSRTGRGILWVVLFFVLMVLMHFQALFFLPALLYLIAGSLTRGRIYSVPSWKLWSVILATTGIAAVAFIFFYSSEIDISGPFLPLFSSGDPSGYSLLSTVHVLDIINQSLVMFPMILAIALWAIVSGLHSRPPNAVRTFLGMSALGSLVFFCTIDPKLGMARDWDLMSLPLLAPMLWLLNRIDSSPTAANFKLGLAVALGGILMSTSYFAANLSTASAEQRFASITTYYGSKDDTGGIILAYYYVNRGDYTKASSLLEQLVGNNSRKADLFQLLGMVKNKQGDFAGAAADFREAVKLKPHQPRIKNLLGQAYMAIGSYAEALSVLKSAHQDDPSLTFVTEGIGLSYYHLGYLDSARATADSLFSTDPHSPGGHLIYMIVSLRQGDTTTARQHYEQYLIWGKSRSDHEGIREHYQYLID